MTGEGGREIIIATGGADTSSTSTSRIWADLDPDPDREYGTVPGTEKRFLLHTSARVEGIDGRNLLLGHGRIDTSKHCERFVCNFSDPDPDPYFFVFWIWMRNLHFLCGSRILPTCTC